MLWPFMWVVTPFQLRVRVLIRHKDQVLVVKHWLGAQRSWQLPGGGKKSKETVLETATREIAEELNINLSQKDMRLLHDTFRVLSQSGLLFRYQFVEVQLASKPEVLTKSYELIDWRWQNVREGAAKDVQEALRLSSML